MAKKHEATDGATPEEQTHGNGLAAPPEPEHDAVHEDEEDEFITLGKSRPSWKPGKHGGITGFLLGESGVPKQDGDVAAIFVVRVTEPVSASIWDKASETESWRTYPAGTEVQIFITRGLQDLRPYTRDPRGIVKIRLPEGKQIKAGKGKFWDLSPKQVGRKLYPRTAHDVIEKAPLPRSAVAASPSPGANARGRAVETDDDAIPF
jgi:hypothetical protein